MRSVDRSAAGRALGCPRTEGDQFPQTWRVVEGLAGDAKRAGAGVDSMDRQAEPPGQLDAVPAYPAADIQNGRARSQAEPCCQVIEHVGPGRIQALVHGVLELLLDLAIRVVIVSFR